MGGRAEQFCSADRSEKNFADLLTKRRLFFIISFLCCDANDAAQTSSTAPGKAGVACSLTTKQPISVGAWWRTPRGLRSACCFKSYQVLAQ